MQPFSDDEDGFPSPSGNNEEIAARKSARPSVKTYLYAIICGSFLGLVTGFAIGFLASMLVAYLVDLFVEEVHILGLEFIAGGMLGAVVGLLTGIFVALRRVESYERSLGLLRAPQDRSNDD
jgi:hypothetical protein